MRRAGNKNSGSSEQGGDGYLPGEEGHHRDGEDDGDEIAHDRRERVGEGLLGTEDVVVQPRDERAGLGTGEERQRHLLDVGEDLLAHVVDQPLADPRGDVALHEGQEGVRERQAAEEQAEEHDEARVVLWMPPSMIWR